ncbi:MAG: type I-G CRISPR-associated protein Cas8g1/Csx17 [Limisphaerales bacterium]|jgi:CRISPR-associated protein Csx17
MNTQIVLNGCSPTPIAFYLKALGVLRLVSEQKDPTAKGCWQRDRFVLYTKLTEKELLDFFLYEYEPTPIVAPWNGGSGFYPKDKKSAIIQIEKSTSPRFGNYKNTINVVKSLMDKYDFVAAKSNKDDTFKKRILTICRNELSDNFLKWVDAAVVITDESLKFPPILGTGGNDGRLDFTNNFMQRLVELIDPTDGKPQGDSEKYLKTSLFGENLKVEFKDAPIGQFLPIRAGGANTTSGFVGKSAINPWDYILMLEGSLLFASACVRRLNPESVMVPAAPFYVEQSAIGYASASLKDEQETRGEIWLPIWEKPASVGEISFIFSEGRAQVGRRLARNGLDFIRAAVTLGVDRGISLFQRYSFQERNGMAYFAIPLDKIYVRRNIRADLLSEIDQWLSRVIGLTKSEETPGSVKTAVRNLQNAIVELCKNDDADHLQEVLIQLGQCEKALSRSIKWTTEKGLRPLSGLSSDWLKYADTKTAEFRLACSLASMRGRYGKEWIPIRCNIEAVKVNNSGNLDYLKEGSTKVVWSESPAVKVFNDIFSRRMIDAEKSGEGGLVEDAVIRASVDDVNLFIQGETDDGLILRLLWGLVLINWGGVSDAKFDNGKTGSRPNALYALMKLCYMKPPGSDKPLPLTPGIHRLAVAGRSKDASEMAAKRLLSSNLAPAIKTISLPPDKTRRVAAAVLFPISGRDWVRLAEAVLRPVEGQN